MKGASIRRFALAAAALCLAAAAPAAASSAAATGSSDQSTAYQGDAAHDGALGGPSGRLASLVPAWTRTLPGASSYPVVAAGMVYVTAPGPGSSYGTTLFALDAATGATVWSHALGGTYFWSAAAYDAGRVFALNFDGLLTAFDAATGKVDWSGQLPGQYAFDSAPSAAGGIVYDGGSGSGGTLYANDERTGALLWSRQVANGGDSSPAVDGDHVYVTYPDTYYAFDRLSGGSAWTTALGGDGGGGRTPVVADGHLYVRDWAASALILSTLDGTTQGPLGSTTAPAVARGRAYEMVGTTLEAAADDGLGSVTWSFVGDGQLDTAPLVVGATVFVGSASGRVYGLDADTGNLEWTALAGQPIAGPDEQNVSQPLTGLGAGGGTLFVPAGNTLVAYAAPSDLLAPVNRLAPSVAGLARAGDQVAADVGVWSNLPSGYAYRWERCDAAGSACTAVAGATGAAYPASADDIGATLRVEVTASNASGSSLAAVSAPSPVVVPPVPVNLSPPPVTGSLHEGQTLTAGPGTWSGSPTVFAFAWRRCQSTYCQPIPGEITSTHLLTPDDDGYQLEVAVIASNAGGPARAVLSVPTPAISSPAPVALAPPFVSGRAAQGETLTTSLGSWQYTPTSYGLQWLRCDTGGSNCAAIDAAQGISYQVTAADVGFTLRSQVAASNSGGTSAPALSGVTAPVIPAPPVNLTPPSVTGTPAVGGALRVDVGSWSNAVAFFTVRWLRCTGAPEVCTELSVPSPAAYAPLAADLGARLRVEVTASSPGGSASAYSAAVGPVAAGAAAGTPADTGRGSSARAPILSPAAAAALSHTAPSSNGPSVGSATVSAPQGLRRLIRDGLIAQVHCPAGCRASAVVTLLSSSRALTVLGHAGRSLGAGTKAGRMRIAISRTGAAALAGRRTATLSVAFALTGTKGSKSALVRNLRV